MIIFDLKCANDHVFEAWFGSSDDYESQRSRGLVSCPVCGDADIGKAAMAPAVPMKGNRLPEAGPSSSSVQLATTGESGVDMEKARAVLESLARAQAAALESSEWVGREFAEQARAMHYGEREKAGIHGEVDTSEAKALIEEGVEVAPLLVPFVPPSAKN
jgi:hypothetical protein